MVNQAVQMGRIFEKPEVSPKKNLRNNEIDVTIWVNGEAYPFQFKAKITGSLMASQITQKGLRPLVIKALQTQFGSIE